MRVIFDKIGGAIMILLGSLLSIYTLVDSLDGAFSHVSRTKGLYQAMLENGAFDFYFSLLIQVGIGVLVCILGWCIYFSEPKF